MLMAMISDTEVLEKRKRRKKLNSYEDYASACTNSVNSLRDALFTFACFAIDETTGVFDNAVRNNTCPLRETRIYE